MATTSAAVQEEPATRFAKDQLRSIIERIERLEEEKSALTSDISNVYSEAKGGGFDVKIMKQIVKLRKMDKDRRDEFYALLDTYSHALGLDLF